MSATGIGATRYHGFNFILGSPTGMARGALKTFQQLRGEYGGQEVKVS
jgi:hypothetical protein